MSKGLQTSLFFSREPFEHALLVNLVLSMRTRGGRSHLWLSHAQWLLCTRGPQGHALDAPSVTCGKHVLCMDILLVGVVFFSPPLSLTEALLRSGAFFTIQVENNLELLPVFSASVCVFLIMPFP